VNATAVASLTPRRRATVAGEIRSVQTYERPYLRTEVELDDGTGIIVLRFVGRRQMPGLVPKLRMVADGTPGFERSALVMLNPLYCFVPAE
jgi:hypothetical protein